MTGKAKHLFSEQAYFRDTYLKTCLTWCQRIKGIARPNSLGDFCYHCLFCKHIQSQVPWDSKISSILLLALCHRATDMSLVRASFNGNWKHCNFPVYRLNANRMVCYDHFICIMHFNWMITCLYIFCCFQCLDVYPSKLSACPRSEQHWNPNFCDCFKSACSSFAFIRFPNVNNWSKPITPKGFVAWLHRFWM